MEINLQIINWSNILKTVSQHSSVMSDNRFSPNGKLINEPTDSVVGHERTHPITRFHHSVLGAN